MHLKDEMSSVSTDSPTGENRANGDIIHSPAVNGRDGKTSSSAKKREKKDIIDNMIKLCKDTNLIVLDLSKKAMHRIPEELLLLSHLEVGK